MSNRTQDQSEAEQLAGKIARWETARERGLAIRVAVRATDLTIDLLDMDEMAAWNLLIARAQDRLALLEQSDEGVTQVQFAGIATRVRFSPSHPLR